MMKVLSVYSSEINWKQIFIWMQLISTRDETHEAVSEVIYAAIV